MNFSLVIPTYKRQKSLAKALDSALQNLTVPTEILIIDDGALPSEFLESLNSRCALMGVSFRYYKKNHATHRRGLSESKNIAVELSHEEIIFYVDDDVVLNKNYFKEIMNIWNSSRDTKLFAVGGKISNNRRQSWFESAVFNKVFGLTEELNWDVTSVGFQVWNEGVQDVQKAHYIHGGASSYKKILLAQFKFATFSGGRTGLEDVELAIRTKNAGYHFVYAPQATLVHYHENINREGAFLSGKKESQNRKEIFKRLCKQNVAHKIFFAWASIGWILKKVTALKFSEAFGMMFGLFAT